MEMSFMGKHSFPFLLWPGACLHLQQQFTTAICHGGAITSTTSSAAFTNNYVFYKYTYNCLFY